MFLTFSLRGKEAIGEKVAMVLRWNRNEGESVMMGVHTVLGKNVSLQGDDEENVGGM